MSLVELSYDVNFSLYILNAVLETAWSSFLPEAVTLEHKCKETECHETESTAN